MSNSVTGLQTLETRYKRVDRNSLLLLLLLTLPAGIMAVVLLLWADKLWIAEISYIVIGILGSFAAVLLAVFIIARYRGQPGIPYISAGLMAIGIIDGFHAISPAGSNEFVWLHSFASIFGGLFFVLYVLSEVSHLPVPTIKTTTKGIDWFLGSVITAALLFGGLTIVFAQRLPAMVQEGQFTPIAWMINAVPITLFLFAGINLFRQYRKTGAQELFVFTAILIFLFQASEIFYFATLWSVSWWYWQALQFAVFLVVLVYVLKEYIQTSGSLAVEVDERKKVESALRKADEDWRNSFNSLEEVMLIINKDYSVEKVNSSGLMLLGKSKEEIINRKCYQVIHGEDKTCTYCPFQQTLKSRKAKSIERYDDLFEKHFSIKSAPIFDECGDIIKFVCLISDITQRIQAELKEKILQQELNLTSRLASIGEVAAGIAHEINNPLTSVIGFAQMLNQMDVPEDIKEGVEVINDGAERVARIVEKLLTFARRNKPDKEYADINSVVSNTLEMRLYEMRTNNIEVITELAFDLPRTMANVGQLQQVFLNIIINAEQAMTASRRAGKLFIKTERIDSSIRISIADNGPGIAQDNIDKLFDPFFTTKDADGGTGLGLSISYGIINEHGGKIYAKSTAGEGATFIIELPIVAETRQPEMKEPPSKEAEKVSGAKIMVVDDEPNICRALDRLLSREEYQVEAISSAQKALQKLSSEKYDVILFDIKMPGMNGIEFYNQMKKIAPSLQQKVICITGDVVSAGNKAFLDKTGIPYITKPFGVNELIRHVESVLGGKTYDAQVTYSYR